MDHNSVAAHLTRSDHARSNVVDDTNGNCCGMTLKRLGVLGVSVRKMTALTVKTKKMEKVTLIGKGK